MMDSDLDIARRATTRPVEEMAERLGIERSDLILQGSSMAKISWDRLKQAGEGKQGFLILVTSVNPTPDGEGKTGTTIGLNQGLNRRGHNATCVIREPSMGPVFGIKGGAAGGGFSQVLPMEEINLHFTGDLHAVTMAHNLCSAMLDNHLHRGNDLNLDLNGIEFCLAVAKKYLNNINNLEFISAGAGIRPQSKIGVPIIKKIFDNDNILFVSGHYTQGMMLSLGTAEIVKNYLLNFDQELFDLFDGINE